MKALTLWDPWASLIALELKRYETRSWATRYRGPLAIHSSLKRLPYFPVELVTAVPDVVIMKYHYGCVIAVVDLVDCLPMTPALIGSISRQERLCGDWEEGRFAWKLANVRRIVPGIPARGRQGLWEWEPPWLTEADPEHFFGDGRGRRL